jgi:hypothetical protein
MLTDKQKDELEKRQRRIKEREEYYVYMYNHPEEFNGKR